MEQAQKRELRLLRILKQKGRLLVSMAGSTHVLLAIPGERTLKFPAAAIKALVSSGAIGLRSENERRLVVLTAEGEARLRRDECTTEGVHGEQHRSTESGFTKVGGVFTAVNINLAESPIGLLSRPRNGAPAWLSSAETGAAERIRKDFEFSQMSPKVTASWDPAATSSARKSGARAGNDRTDFAIAASDRLNAAMKAMGPELAGVVLDVCCFLKGLELVERERKWPRRSAKLMLKAGLAALARHYNPPTERNAKTRHWGVPGYKPIITGR